MRIVHLRIVRLFQAFGSTPQRGRNGGRAAFPSAYGSLTATRLCTRAERAPVSANDARLTSGRNIFALQHNRKSYVQHGRLGSSGRILVPQFYEKHILRRPAAEWPDGVNRTFQHVNEHIYVLMQGPSELGASGRLEKWDRFADLKRIKVPTLVMGAKYDTMDPAHMEAWPRSFQKASSPSARGGVIWRCMTTSRPISTP